MRAGERWHDTVADGLAADASGLATALTWQPVDVPGRHPDPGDDAHHAAPSSRTSTSTRCRSTAWCAVARRMLERYVTWDGDWFAETEGEPSEASQPTVLEAAGVSLADGQLVEVRPAATAWLRGCRRHAWSTASCSSSTTATRRPSCTARDGWRGRWSPTATTSPAADPFVAIGRQDMTTHVDLTALEVTARTTGLDMLGSTTQARLLVGPGTGRAAVRPWPRPVHERSGVPRGPGERGQAAGPAPPRRLSGAGLRTRHGPWSGRCRGFATFAARPGPDRCGFETVVRRLSALPVRAARGRPDHRPGAHRPCRGPAGVDPIRARRSPARRGAGAGLPGRRG